jgi:hypothetical protein
MLDNVAQGLRFMGSCEPRNEHLGSIKGTEFFDRLLTNSSNTGCLKKMYTHFKPK